MAAASIPTLAEVFRVFLRLGCTSFGGPIAHLGYFHEAFVERRKWLDAEAYADLVALAQFLPGPASTQIAMGIGALRAGPWGAALAWLGFTLPSAVLMIAFGYGAVFLGGDGGAGALHGLKIVAVAVVAQAVWMMARRLCPDTRRQAFAVAAAALTLLWPGGAGQIAAIALAALFGRWLLRDKATVAGTAHRFPIGRRLGAVCLALFFLLLVALPLAALLWPERALAVVAGFYRAGSLVFGGGHVLLPLLQAVVVSPGWVTNDAFLAGYGAAQALPGPLFAFSAYLGMAMPGGGWAMGLLCLAAISLPSSLLIYGALPFWNALRGRLGVRAALLGVNAAVVGLLVAVLYSPMWTGTVKDAGDFVFVLAALAGLALFRLPPWLVAGLAAAVGATLGALAF